MARLILAGLLLASIGNATAQSSGSMEQRLRAQLQATTTQLQQAQSELAQLRQQAAPAPQSTPAAADEEVQQLKQQLAAQRARGSGGEQQARQLRTQLAERDQQLQQQNRELAQLRQQQSASSAQLQQLSGQHTEREQALQQCQQRNQALYDIGQDVLHAYENLGVGSVLRQRQPFAAQSRARYEQWAQEQGDRMYQNRIGARPLPPATDKKTDSSRATGEEDEPTQVVPEQ